MIGECVSIKHNVFNSMARQGGGTMRDGWVPFRDSVDLLASRGDI